MIGDAARPIDVARARALGCPRCGGALAAGPDPAQLTCAYCGYASIRPGEGGVAAWMPAGRIGRRRAASLVAQSVAAAGVRGFAVEGTQLLYVPFWHLQLKLVGWQRYRVRRAAVPHPAHEETGPLKLGELSPSQGPDDDPIEELVARDVSHSAPACDARELGLLGIADRLAALKLRPFDPERMHLDELACAVVHPLAAARRTARLYHAARLVPAGAGHVHQRLDILRTHARLVYYPVYRVHYRSGGLRHWATVDGVRARVLAGTRPLHLPDRTPAWLVAGATSSVSAGLHPALGLVVVGAWAWLRLRSRQGPETGLSLACWLSEETGSVPAGVATLEPIASTTPAGGTSADTAVAARGPAGRPEWN